MSFIINIILTVVVLLLLQNVKNQKYFNLQMSSGLFLKLILEVMMTMMTVFEPPLRHFQIIAQTLWYLTVNFTGEGGGRVRTAQTLSLLTMQCNTL